jgi:hypothetical protein
MASLPITPLAQPISFTNTVLVVNGVPITGFADGDDAISFKRLTDSASHKIGADGLMMVSLSADRSGEVDIKLFKTSLSNAYLNGLLAAQESPGGVAFVPIYVTALDVLRQDMGVGSAGYLKKVPDLQFGEHGTVQQWSIIVQNLTNTFGTGIIATL